MLQGYNEVVQSVKRSTIIASVLPLRLFFCPSVLQGYHHRHKSSDPSAETITIECSLSPHIGVNGDVPSLHTMEKEIVLNGKSNVNIALDMTCTPDCKWST